MEIIYMQCYSPDRKNPKRINLGKPFQDEGHYIVKVLVEGRYWNSSYREAEYLWRTLENFGNR
jgi:hypothetical protein